MSSADDFLAGSTPAVVHGAGGQALTTVAWIAIASGVLSALIVAVDIARGRRQHMWIMNLVWPLTALYAGPLGLVAYFKTGLLATEENVRAAEAKGEDPPGKRKPFWQMVALAASHCGAGCTLGDLLAESFVLVVPITLFGRAIFGTWLVDFVAAFVIGVAFQYLTIKPMRQLSPSDGLKQALKADAASLTAWQLGMYGWMAIATFVLFGHELPKDGPVFWFMMQLAMLVGFLTSFPVNWWLLRAGVKEKM